jgi:PIN domain nuclease of toxin-antitoxin system
VSLLLDTHAFLWFILDDLQLSAKADAVITDPNNDLEISPASYWEVAIKISSGKYTPCGEDSPQGVGRIS